MKNELIVRMIGKRIKKEPKQQQNKPNIGSKTTCIWDLAVQPLELHARPGVLPPSAPSMIEDWQLICCLPEPNKITNNTTNKWTRIQLKLV
jgi:uncharacterized protein YmfQ (DUF2313 family)